MANATYRQTSAVQAAQAAKADALKARQHLAVVETKEAANVVANAEAATGDKVVVLVATIAGGQVLRVQVANAVAEAVRVDQAAQADQVPVVAVRVEIVQAVRERDNN